MKKLYSRFWWNFDRIFGDNKRFGWQVSIILGLVIVLVLFVGFIGWSLIRLNAYTHFQNCRSIVEAIGLMFGASNIPPGDKQYFPIWWQAIAYLIGAVFFSGVTITFVGNWLSNRQEAYIKGTVRYWFEDHLLFLGGSRIILPMIKTIAGDKDLNKLDIVVLSSIDIEHLRNDIDRTLSPKVRKALKITVLAGDHYDSDTLKSVHVNLARKIYIAGDYLSGSEHDSENVACWEAAKTLCEGRKNTPCFLYLSRASSVQLFNRRNDNSSDCCLDTTIINFLESVAQRVLVHNRTENKYYPALDRNGIGPNDDRTVHVVITGTTSMSFAMAITAAHLCHFPNCVDQQTFEIIPSRRTKITYITPNMKEEMNFITSHLASLFKLSHYTYIKDDFKIAKKPDAHYGDFLDIEWEFLDGSIADGWVIDKMKEYYDDCVNKQTTYLTVALCESDADKNIAAAVYLPSEFHRIVRNDDDSVNYEKTIPLLVYQPKNETLVRNVHDDTKFYENMFAFGSQKESYDPSIRQRIKEGKRINYIYDKGLDYQYLTSDQDELDRQWREKKYVEQMSNIYCANHIGVKLRSVGIGEKELNCGDKIPKNYIKLMAVVEHNRWNIEKLLVGFEPLEQLRRQEFKNSETNRKIPEDVKKEIKKLKDKQYIHNCIAPFNELLEGSKDYDYLIVKNLTDVLDNENK